MNKLHLKRKTVYLFKNRLISLLLTAVMLLTSVNLAGVMALSSADGNSDAETDLVSELLGEDAIVRNDALHFYIRHWHTQKDNDAKLQGTDDEQLPGDETEQEDGEEKKETTNFFVIAEGYIVPDKKTGEAPYSFYFVGRNTDNNKKEIIPIEKTGSYDTSYVLGHSVKEGTITLSVKVLKNEFGSDLENFSGFSISAGHDAVEYNEVNGDGIQSITIKYDKNVHLVKGHVFYVRATKRVDGSNDSSLRYTSEIDTTKVYVYIEDGKDPVEHKAGDIVKHNGKACETEEELAAAGVSTKAAELKKFYSASSGLHTDNAILYETDEGRIYQFDLAAWYVQGIASQVGLILDASGGFAFAYDFPDPINVYSVLGDSVSELLGDKIDGIQNEKNRAENDQYLYPKRMNMIGYYEIRKGASSGNARTWYFNSIEPTVSGDKRPYVNPADIKNPENYDEEYFAKAFYPQTGDGDFNFGDETKSKVIKNSHSDFDSLTGDKSTNWGTVPAQFAENNGGLNIAGGKGDSAFILSDASTPADKFTLSFIMLPNTPVSEWEGDTTEILYIGPKSGTVEDAEFRLVRDNNNDLVLYHKGEIEVLKSDIPASDKQTLTFTFDGNNTLKFYYNGVLSKKISMSLNPECVVFDPFADGGANQSTPFYVDEMMVYDVDLNINEVDRLYNASGKSDTNQMKNVDDTSGFSWDNIFLTESQLAYILNTHNTDNSLNGYSGYSYFVYNSNPGTLELAPLAYWDGAKTDNNGLNRTTRAFGADGKLRAGTSDNLNGAGWYYMSSASWDHAKTTGTAKRMAGINNGATFYDRTDGVDNTERFFSGTPAYYNEGDYAEWEKGEDTKETYTPKSNSPTKFYVDNKGNLRCFFNNNINTNMCSYVYELADDQYVKTEAMQRVLGNFTTMLIDRSPATEVSAVRFSGDANTEEDRDKLVLLDWSNNASDLAEIMSMKYGEGGFNDSVPGKNGVDQYNYVLTGASYIHSALESFRENLVPFDNKDKNTAKFLIVITDGSDTEISDTNPSEKSKSVAEANKLKSEGYTIMSVMFGGTTFNSSHPDYKDTKEHMERIASRDKDGNPYLFTTDNLEDLMDKFSEAILDTISKALEDYTVKNYIDPRFNVVGSNGAEYLLGAGGNVEILFNGNRKPVNVVTKPTTVTLAGTTDSFALTPSLCYDASKDMYYLEWTGQNIPTSAEGAPVLGVWSAQITLKAKDDFIGGNAVITNGNEAYMNWVYHPADNPNEREAYINRKVAELTDKDRAALQEEWQELSPDQQNKFGDFNAYVRQSVVNVSALDASSGTDDTLKEYKKVQNAEGELVDDLNNPIDEYVSKGFPRTAVNVQLKDLNTKTLNGIIYEGEMVSSAQLLTEIEDEYVTSTYYLEYLRRFAYQRYLYFLDNPDKLVDENGNIKNVEEELNMPLLALLNKWLELDSDNRTSQEDKTTQNLKQFSVRYMYLPSVTYDKDGKIDLDNLNEDGTANLTNNAGNLNKDGRFDMENVDVLGILTYRWQQLDSEGKPIALGDKDYVKNNAQKTAYSITVEFTPLQVGDTLEHLNSSEIADTENEIAKKSYETYGSYMFAGRIIFRSPDAHKEGWTAATSDLLEDDFVFDRKAIVDSYVKDKVYSWNPKYRPALDDAVQPDSSIYDENSSVTLKNHDRTLVAETKYEQEAVSGGVALEMKLLIGELKQLLKDGDISFTMKATRKFKDTSWAEELKAAANPKFKDYGNEYTITFEVKQDDLDIKELEKAAAADKFGYVTIFAKTTKIEGYFGNEKKEMKDGLPIGTYTFTLEEANKGSLNKKIKFAAISSETDPTKFSKDYFHEEVLDLTEGKEKTHLKNPTVKNFIAGSGTNENKTVASFYIGTSEKSPERGNVEYDTEKARYTDARLGIVVLSTGTVKLTIDATGEKGNKENENYLYRITGNTLGYEDVNLVVSVKSGESKTIVILPGEYTVTEISDWSWRYENCETEEVVGKWTIDETDKRVAKITIDSLTGSARILYTHVRNDMQWLGGESSESF